MSRRPLDDESLRAAVRSPGYRPARADVPALFERFERDDDAIAEAAERALERLGHEAAETAIARFDEAGPPARARLARLVGRVARGKITPEARHTLVDFLVVRLDDADAKTRRAAIIALGKLGEPATEAALLARFVAPAPDLPERRALAAALGKLGGPSALAALDAVHADDAELRRIVDEARLRLRRTLGRSEPEGLGAIDAQASPERPLRVLLHAREGLAPLVACELGDAFGAKVVDDATVDATLRGPLGGLYRARTALRFGFPLACPRDAADPGAALVEALTSKATLAIFRAFTRGPIRYRIEWASAGRRRGLTYRVAEAVAARRPELLNDPTASLWEVVVDESRGLAIELWPRGLEDPRFAYRKAHVPASSHPTIAAALALLAEARPDDVVWDPFVGAGTELVERAMRGPYRKMIGTDLDAEALERARTNVEAAGLASIELLAGDARRFTPPERPTLVLTNPPMGRRVLDKTKTGPLYDAFLTHVAKLLPPGGRLVWISPRPMDTARRAEALGLRAVERRKVDMGGFFAEIQRFDAGARAGDRVSSGRRR